MNGCDGGGNQYMNFCPKWHVSRSKNTFFGWAKVAQSGPKHAPGTPGIPKKFQVFPVKIELFP